MAQDASVTGSKTHKQQQYTILDPREHKAERASVCAGDGESSKGREGQN
jgi:hypothetical protein